MNLHTNLKILGLKEVGTLQVRQQEGDSPQVHQQEGGNPQVRQQEGGSPLGVGILLGVPPWGVGHPWGETLAPLGVGNLLEGHPWGVGLP